MHAPVELEILTRTGQPGEGAQVKGLFAGVFQDVKDDKLLAYLDKFCPVKIKDLLESKEISGNFKEYHILHLGPEAPIDRVVLIGLGTKKGFDRDIVRSSAAKAARTLRKLRCPSMAVVVDAFAELPPEVVAEAVVEGTLLGLYRYERQVKEKKKEEPELEQIVLYCKDKKIESKVREGVRRGVAIADAANKARVLANMPPNMLVPEDLAEFGEGLAKKHKHVETKVFGEKQLHKMGAGGILGVGQGSPHQSFLVDAYYKGGKKDALTVALIGKGVTFDTGGISIKPADGMHRMKYDMSGAAAVLGAVDVAASLGLPVNLRAIVPTAENMPDGAAYKPGDVLHMMSGHYVEVLNTDAEGRLLLADGLWYGAQTKPDFMIDLATLTGAIIVALGHSASGVFSNCPALPKLIVDAGAQYNEKFWPMPLFPEYKIHISSQVADITNDGGRPAASSSAAIFLQTFTDNVAWAHLDIAGTAWIEESTILYAHKPYLPKRGATGFGVRTLASLLMGLCDRVTGPKGGSELAALRKQLAERS